MKQNPTFMLCVATVLGTWTLVGCQGDAPDQPAAAGDAASTTDPDAADDPLAAMPAADRVAALAQKMCPVADSPLGSMGTPIKVTVEGRDVYLCCEHCRDMLVADPQKYFAKLDAATADNEGPAAAEGEAADADAAG